MTMFTISRNNKHIDIAFYNDEENLCEECRQLLCLNINFINTVSDIGFVATINGELVEAMTLPIDNNKDNQFETVIEYAGIKHGLGIQFFKNEICVIWC